MPFPASQQILFEAFQQSRIVANRVKERATFLRDQSAAGPTPRPQLIAAISLLSNAIGQWQSIAAVPGIAQYARDQLDDQTVDIAAEFVTMRNAAIALRDWIAANFPTDATSGAWLVSAYDSDGVETPLEFTTAQMAGFRTRADTLIASIA